MKTRLIYFLIGLMVISLIGIIVLQSGWVSDAISEREKEFESRGNNAMNDINEVIGQDEDGEYFRGMVHMSKLKL